MSDLPDYCSLTRPTDKPYSEYSHHERRAEICDMAVQAGALPPATQTQLADRYDVADSTISRDIDRIEESLAEHFGEDYKSDATLVYKHILDELADADDWRAAKALSKEMRKWREVFQSTGDLEQEPDRAEVDVDMTARQTEVSYTIVREELTLPTDEDGSVDYEDLGFTEGPASVEVTAADDLEGDDD